MAGEYRLTGLAVPDGLDDLHELLARAGEEHPDLSPNDLMLFETAVIEVAGNVIEHGRPPGEVTWTFTLSVGAERIVAVLADDGLAPEPTVLVDPSMPDATAEAGRGVALAAAVLDELAYDRQGDVNRWTMVRNRS